MKYTLTLLFFTTVFSATAQEQKNVWTNLMEAFNEEAQYFVGKTGEMINKSYQNFRVTEYAITDTLVSVTTHYFDSEPTQTETYLYLNKPLNPCPDNCLYIKEVSLLYQHDMYYPDEEAMFLAVKFSGNLSQGFYYFDYPNYFIIKHPELGIEEERELYDEEESDGETLIFPVRKKNLFKMLQVIHDYRWQ